MPLYRILSVLLFITCLCSAPEVARAVVFPCSEQGVLDAVALGGGPHTFECAVPTVIVTTSEIVPSVYVKLDGEGNLTLDGNDTHRLFHVPSNVTLELEHLTLANGRATDGGALLVDGTLILEEVTVEGNTATATGGGILNRGDLALRRSRIVGNTANDGGGIYGGGNSHAEFISDTTIADNDASSSSGIGGGMALCRGTVDRSTFSGNSARYGGGYWHDSGLCVFTNTTFSDNHGVSAGGGIRIDDGSVELFNVTLANNTADSGASELALNCCDPVTLENVLVSGGCSNSILGSVSLGGSIESPGDGCGFDAATDLVSLPAVDLLLGPLADNGGPTETHALLSGSPAIDGGILADCPLEDQRGVPRPDGAGCDTGAVEFVPEPSHTAMLVAGLMGLWGCHVRRLARLRRSARGSTRS